MAETVTHMPPPWVSAKDRAHAAWQSFMDYMKHERKEPTPRLWTLWHAAYGHGTTDEMKRYFAEAQKLREAALAEMRAKSEAATEVSHG